jgi:uncharacterized protein YqeY
MHLKDRLQEDLKAAMKSGDIARRDAIRSDRFCHQAGRSGRAEDAQ